MAEVEGKLQLHANKTTKSNKGIAFNFIFSVFIIFVVIQALKVNILSSYNPDVEYFHCGWNTFEMHSNMESVNGTWSHQYEQCISSHIYIGVPCDWYKFPRDSGVLWYYCNVISFFSLGISGIGYIVIFFTNNCSKIKQKYSSTQPKLSFVTVIFQSFIPTISLLVAIISWFGTNGNLHGCWCSKYMFYAYDYYDEIFQFNNRQIGESMIFDIIAVAFLGIHFLVYVNHFCAYLGFSNEKKKKRKGKYGEPMLFENNNYNGQIADAEYEGYGGCQNHVKIESIVAIIPADDQIDESDVQIGDIEESEYKCVQKWFFESVTVPKDYKQNYYDKFIENGFDNFVVIKCMTNKDLIDIGVDKLGHRKTILIATQKL